jgi:hypothetical protein
MTKHSPETAPLSIWIISIIGVFSIMAALTGLMYYFTKAPSSDQVRFAERQQFLTDLTAQANDQLDQYSLIDPVKNIVRLPINRAMEVIVQEWENPGLARTNLLERLNNISGTNIVSKSTSQ